ncbi:immunoglobulin-like domain-containing protein [Clostridioides difficile]
MYNKKVTSILLSTIIASSTNLGITHSNINVFADNKQAYRNNLADENISLNMGEYECKNSDGILRFPKAKGVIKGKSNLIFNFDGENNVKVSYTKNGSKMEGITYEPTLKSRVINIRVENQEQLNEVLKSLEIKGDGNVSFSVKLANIPEGVISSNGAGQEEAIDGNLGSHFRADGAGWWQLLFNEETELDKINLTFGRKNGAEIQALKDGNWIKIGEAEDYPIDLYSRETQTIKVDKGMYSGIKVIPKISDDNMSRLCEISFDVTEAESFSYTDSPNLNLGESIANGSFITFPHAMANGFDRLSLKLEYSVPIKTEYTVNGNKINSDEKVIITDSYDRKTINEILKSLKLNTNNQKVKINASLVDTELKKTFPDGTITTGAYYGTGYPTNVIDCDLNTYWNAPSESGSINFKFPTQTEIDNIKLKISPSVTIKNQYTITGKKGNSSEIIGQVVATVKGNEMNTVAIPITKPDNYDEINVNSTFLPTGGLGTSWASIQEVILNSNLEEELASDSVTVDKIENIFDLELGEKKVINNKITFPNATGKVTGVGSKVLFELNNIENQDTFIKYQLNGEEIIKKDKTVKIEINSQKELDEILKSLEITFDELKGCSLKIFSMSSDADIENLSWQVLKNITASGPGYGNNQPQNVFKGSVGWNAGAFNTSMYLKNTNNIYLSAIRYYSKNALIVKGKDSNGAWKEIGSFGANLSNTKFDVIPGSYDELQFYSYGGDWAHIYDLEFLMSDGNKECSNISINKSNFEITDFKSDGNGNITFPNATGDINTNASLDIEFKNGYNKNLVTTYALNGEEKRESKENISINIENNEQLEEVLNSLKISHDNTSNLDISFSLNFASGKNIKKDIIVGTDDKLDMGEIQYSEGKITFKNANGKIRDKANLNFSSKTDLEVKYISDGKEIIETGKNIVIKDLTQDTLDEFLKSFTINYNEYEGCEFSISLLGKPVTITKNYSIPQVQGDLELNLGDYENDGNGNVLFPNAKGLLYRKGNLNINFEKGFSNDIEIKYKLNDIEYTKKQNSLSIALSNQKQLDEVLKTLKIKCDSSLEYDLNITLAEERYIPLGTTSDKPEALTGGWYSGKGGNTAIITFNSPLKISTVSISKTSGVDNRFYIKGLKNNTWKDIGNFTIFYPNYDYTKLREIDVQRDSYDAISIYYVVNNGWGSANVSKLGFLDKVSTNIKIKPDINLKVTLVDNLEKAKLKWNSDLEAYAYNIYVKKKDDKSWTLSKSVTSDINEIDDYSIKDSVAPLVPEYKIQDELKKGIQLNSDDLGSEYSYYINAIDKNGNKIGTSNVENINIQSDFKEFVYEVSNSSTIPLELKNKSNGFIQFRDLVDKNYLYVASVDNAGNISAIKTIPILGLFVDEPPVINVPGDSSLKANSKIDVNEGVSATDEIDGDLTSKINTKIISPKGEVVSDIDTNILGNWIIEYKVTDSKGQTTEYIRKINVIKNINLKLNVGELLTTSKFTQFPNAKIESKETDKKINGIKMYFSDDFNNEIKLHYTVDGIEKVVTDRIITLNNEFSIKEAEELIHSIKIEHSNSKTFKFNIRLSSNDAEDIVYNYKNNHYYKFIKVDNIDWEDARKEAEKQEMFGTKGYLATITSQHENDICNLFTGEVFWIGGFFENIWKWVTGEDFNSYNNWMKGQPDRINGEKHIEMYKQQWNDFDSFNSDKYPEGRPNGFVVEFGLEDRLPSPDTVSSFDYESIINIEPFKSKQDIALNTLVDKKENKVILDWNDVKDISYYKVFQKKNDIGDFQVISSDKNESYFEDIEGKDINEPTTPIYKLYDTGIKQGLKFDSEDVVSKFEYYVEGVSEFGDVTHTSNKKMVEIKSGLEGFSYEITDNAIPSSNLGNVINSVDGFISAKELASKKYVHIISIDKAGNKSQIVTLPIVGLFIDNPPVLKIGGNISVSQNEKYDVMENISAEDDYDGDLTKDIKVSIKNPNGKITDKFDTNILGKWKIEYSVKDSKEQESKAIKYITVKENFDYLNLDLGEVDKKRFLVNFPNAKITNNSNELINGIKLYISEGFNNSILIKYNDKGVKKSVKGQQVILTDKYTTEEAEELIKSIEIEHDNSTSFTFNVRLQNNNVDDMVYNPQNGNYYQFVEAKRISWKNAKLEAEKMEYKGLKGHLATIKSKYELDLFNSLTTKTVWIGATDEEKEGRWKWVTGELVGEPVKFTNWCPGEPNNFGGTEHYMVSIKNSKGLWNDTNNSPDPYWTDIEGFVVEFENDKNNDSSIIYKYEDTAHIQKIVSNQDIVLNSTNDNKNNCVNLSWNKYKDSKYYKVFRRELNSDSDEFKTILESTKENYLKDVDGKDITPPVYDFSLIFDKEMSSRLEFHAEEVGTTYEYKIESYDKDDYQTAYSNVSKATVTSKFKGYSYIVDESPDTELDNIINNTDGKFSFENITYNTYLHIKAIDEQGNATKTKHIKLADETHNNEPRITVKGKNRVIKIGEEFNKLDGVKAYDLEDGDLTDKLVVEGEVNNQVKGVYEIKYSVEDSKGLKSEVIVKVNVTGDMKLNIEEPKKDELIINWNEVKNAVKYKLYRTDVNGYDFEEKGVFNDTTFIDNSANDVSSPIITYLNEVIIGEETSKIGRLTILTKNIIKLADKGINKESEQNTELKLLARDLASTYRYFVEAIDINGNVVNSSEIKNGSVSVGLAGFNYIIDDKEDTEAANFVNAKNVSDIDISNSKFKFLHVRAIDLNGNVSQTAHHLISSKYDTNHIPVIRGVNTTRVKEGNKFDPFEGISAYDTEDGDLTSKIEVEGKVNSDVNGKYLLTYKVEDSQGNKREVKRNVIVYADMEIKVTPDFKENNLVISWEENPLKDKVFYEVRKYDYEIGNYKTIGYTEDLNFVDKNAKDIFGSKINNVHGSDMDTDELEDKITLNINARDIGAYEKYQVRTRLKEDNLILRDMTSEEGNEWGVTGSISGVVESFKWKLSNKREDNLKSGMITTSISPNKIEFEHKGYKYIHIMPIDSYGNEGDIVHYEIGKPPAEEVIEPPIIDIAGVPIINGVSTATIMIGDEFKIMKGVTAKDFKGQDLTNFIKVKGFVNRYEKGEYELVYSVIDFKGQETSRICKVKVIDYSEQIPDSKPNGINSSPEVNFWDEDYIYVGEKYEEDRILNGIRVIDAEDGDITHKVTYETNLDINEVGTYVILYSVSDDDGNKVKFTRIVYVIEKGADKPNIDNDTNWQNGRWARIKTHNKYINVGDAFNIKSGVYAYDDVDGDITSKIKSSGIVNTVKPGAYSVTYKVTNSDNNTTVAGATIFVKDGGWDNNDGEEPNPNPDWGDNDNDNSHDNNIPSRPDEPNQDEDDINKDKLPNIDDDKNKDDNKDIFIDKDGNKVFPDGTIEKPDGTEVKPNEEGEKPTIDDEGNIIVPPDSVIVKPDGTVVIPPTGAIIKPDGTIVMNEEEDKNKENTGEEESKYNDTNKDNEVDKHNVTNIKNEKDRKEEQKSELRNNPSTGDRGIISSITIFVTSLTGYLFLNKKRNKKK